MPDKPPPDDMRDLWRNQTTEPPRVSLERFRDKARRLQTKTKHEVYRGYALGTVMFFVFGYGLVVTQARLQRAGLGILMAWAILIPVLAHRKLWPGPLFADTAAAPSIVFYRSQLERHQEYQRRLRLWLPPMLLGVGLYLSPAIAGIAANPSLAPNVLPFCTLLAIWFVFFFYLRRRKLRELRRKLDDLAGVDNEIRS